jgi:hypothetical protein
MNHRKWRACALPFSPLHLSNEIDAGEEKKEKESKPYVQLGMLMSFLRLLLPSRCNVLWVRKSRI